MQVGNGYFCSSIARTSFCGYNPLQVKQIQKIFLAKLGNVPRGSKYVNPLQVYFCKGFFVVCRPISGAAFFSQKRSHQYV